MDINKNYTGLKKFLLGLGLDLFGVADIRSVKNSFQFSPELLAKLDKAVVLGVRLAEAVLEEISQSPTRLYFHHYRTTNMFLDQAALRAVHYIEKKGYLAVPVPASQIVDWQKQTAHLSHKKLGELAGLGWIGRNNLLVNPKLGSCLRLVSILTDMPLKADKPIRNDCGACRICIKACPAQAIKEDPADFDHLRCFEKLKEFQRDKLAEQYICGVCVKACRGKA